MFQSGCPLEFWSECILTAVFLINRTHSSVLNGNPMKLYLVHYLIIICLKLLGVCVLPQF